MSGRGQCCMRRRQLFAPADLAQGFAVSREFYTTMPARRSTTSRFLGAHSLHRELGATRHASGKTVIAANIIDIGAAAIAKKPARREREPRSGAPVTALGAMTDPEPAKRSTFLFDNYFLESSLYKDGLVGKTVAALSQRALLLGTAALAAPPRLVTTKHRVMRKLTAPTPIFCPTWLYHVTSGSAVSRRPSPSWVRITTARSRGGFAGDEHGHCAGLPGLRAAQMIARRAAARK